MILPPITFVPFAFMHTTPPVVVILLALHFVFIFTTFRMFVRLLLHTVGKCQLHHQIQRAPLPSFYVASSLLLHFLIHAHHLPTPPWIFFFCNFKTLKIFYIRKRAPPLRRRGKREISIIHKIGGATTCMVLGASHM